MILQSFQERLFAMAVPVAWTVVRSFKKNLGRNLLHFEQFSNPLKSTFCYGRHCCLNSGSGFKKNLLYFLHHRCGILYSSNKFRCRIATFHSRISAVAWLKGQLISKAIYGPLTSPKKQTDEFVLFAFLLFRANKSNSSVRFLVESTTRQSAFWN